MARTVDPARHAARRMHIIDAALTCFAAHGYDGATTAAICRTAGIGSGTFFHYFPTKAAVLVAVLELGTQETAEWFAAHEGEPDARRVLLDWVRWTADELADPRVAGFVHAVSAAVTQPDVAAALAADERSQSAGLLQLVRRAVVDGRIRQDLSPETITSWLTLLVDGFVDRIAADETFTTASQKATLVDTVERFLAVS